MISRKTIVSLMLALLLGTGIKAYTLRHIGPCDAYLAHQPNAPETVIVDPQGHATEVPCSNWVLRQPRGVQIAAFFDMALLVVFGISAAADWNRRQQYE